MKILQFLFTAGLFCATSYAFLSIDDFQEQIESKCYDFKNNQELINGQNSPLPSSLETFVSIVERLEQQRYNAEKILRGLIGSFRYDDLLYKISGMEGGSFVTRGGPSVKKIHQMLEEIFGETMNDEFKDTDLSEDERCALYFMISHTVNDTVLPNVQQETLDLDGLIVLKHPREQGVVNLNTRTRHAFALGKVLLGILVGLQGAEKTVSAESLFRKFSGRAVPEILKGMEINILHAVTISDVLALTLQYKKEKTPTSELLFLPNGFWDDSVCPTKYILDDNMNFYATKALIRGALDGLVLGKKMKQLKDTYSEIRLSQILRIYYSSGMAASDSSLAEISWCNRHSLFSSYQNEISDQATLYYTLYAATNDEKNFGSFGKQMTDIVGLISSQASSIFDEIYNEDDDGCRSVSSGSRICETPSEISAILDYKASVMQKEMQYQIIGNLSVGLNMGPGGSSMTVYSNLRPGGGGGGGYKLQTINSTAISGCASCAAKYYGFFDVVSTSTESEAEVFRDLNRTLTPDDLPNPNDNEAGVPSKVVLYFNYLSPSDTPELRNAVWDFRRLHRGTKVFAIGSKKDSLRPFVESPDFDIFDKNDVRSVVTSLKERVCKVPAQFQYQNCYRNSRSDEATNVYHGFITPYHIQYWAMYPKYFLKSFNIEMSFTTLGGAIKVCFTRYYDEIYGTRPVNLNNCHVAEGEKAAKFTLSNPCKKYNVNNCSPFYFTIEATNIPSTRCSGTNEKRCKTPNQIEFEFKHTGISCNRGFSFAATPMTLAMALFVSVFFAFKH